MPALARRIPRSLAPRRQISPRDSAGIRTITASAARVPLGDREAIEQLLATRQTWQEEAWSYRRSLGELRYAVAYLGNSAMRMRLFPAAYLPGGAVPTDATNSPGLPPDLVQAASDTITRLATGGPFALGQLLKKQTENFEVAGECNLVGTVDATGVESWNIYSVSELVMERDGRVGIRPTPSASTSQLSPNGIRYLAPNSSYVTRLWWPDPQFGSMADSPVRAALSLCYELQLLSLDLQASIKSRIVNNGLLGIPEGLTVLGATPQTEGTIEGDPVMRALVDAAMAALTDEGSAAAVLPILLRGPADSLDKIKHIPIDRTVDKLNTDRRIELISRIATTIDLPSEVLTGKADLNHWTGWQIDDDTFRHHIEPMVQVLVDSLTAGFLWPMLRAYKRWPPELIRRVCIWYDPTELVTHPDRSADAKVAFDSGAIGRAALRDYLGMSAADKPDDLDEILYVLKNAARVDPSLLTAILKSLKQTSITIPDAPAPPPTPPQLVLPNGQPALPPAAPGAPALPVPTQTPATKPPPATGSADGAPQRAPQAGSTTDITNRLRTAQTNVRLRKAIAAAGKWDRQLESVEQRLALSAATNAEQNHQGTMVALYPPPDVANQLALPDEGAEPPDDLHITLAYLPQPYNDQQLAELQQHVDQYAANCQPLEGVIGGKGEFNPTDGSDGQPVTYASADVPGLAQLRNGLVQHLESNGHEVAGNHDFTPHMTLMYGTKPELDVPTTPVAFDQLTVARGDDRSDHPFDQAAAGDGLVAAGTPVQSWHDESLQLAQLDRELRARIHTAANSAMHRGFERAGAKVVSKTRTAAGRQLNLSAAIDGCSNAEVPLRIGASLLAALGINDVFGPGVLDELRAAWDRWVDTSQKQALATAARIAGVDIMTLRGVSQKLEHDREAGWSYLQRALQARASELIDKLGIDEGIRLQVTDLVQYGAVRAAISIAGGHDPATLTPQGTPTRANDPVGGIGTGRTITEALTEAGAHIQRYRWRHGWAENPFEPHLALDGTEFTDFADSRFRAPQLPSGADFPSGGFYTFGDHPGCTCDFEVIWETSAAQMVAAGRWDPAKHPRGFHGKFGRGVKAAEHGGGGSGKVRDTPSTKYGLKWDSSNPHRMDVQSAKRWDGWDKLPTTQYKFDGKLHATEEHLMSKWIDKVVSGKEPFRGGYDPHILINEKGEHFVIDGHHRVAMHTALGHDAMPAKVLDLRPEADAERIRLARENHLRFPTKSEAQGDMRQALAKMLARRTPRNETPILSPLPLDEKLVNFRPNRDLNDRFGTDPIRVVIPEAEETTYSRMPFLHELHKSAGLDPNGDVGNYMQQRKDFFDSLPVEDVPLDRLVVTQHRVNTARVQQMRDHPETRGKGVPYFVEYEGKLYAIDGHHRVVSDVLDSAPATQGRVLHLPPSDGTRNQAAANAADALLSRVSQIEPKVTNDLQNVAAENHAELTGLDFRVKSKDSLTRKIRDKSVAKKLTPEQYAAQIGDALRYTALINASEFGPNASQLIASLRARGYKVQVENLWSPDNTYRGLHADLVTPEGQPVEFQLHTPESLALKTQVLHPMYERARDPNTPEAEVRRLNREMRAAWEAIPQPVGVNDIAPPISRPAIFSQLPAFLAEFDEQSNTVV